jgi:PAS domain S-box-containing protein
VAQQTSAELLVELLERLRGDRPGFAEILDALAEAVTIRDPDDHIIYANRAAVVRMGFDSPEALRSRPPRAILADYIVHDEHGREVGMERIPSVRLLAGKPAGPLVIRTINRATGALRWDRLKAALLRDESGKAVAAVTIIEDITQEKIAERRDHFLAAATQTLMSSLDYQQTLRNVAWLAVPEIADWCAVDLVDARGERQQVAVAHHDPQKLGLAEQLRRYQPQTLDREAGLGRVLRTGVGELYPEIDDELLVATAVDAEHLRLLRTVGARSVLVVPLRARGRTVGAMTLATAESMRRFGKADMSFAEQLADRAGVAVDNARLATSRLEVARTLQRSLLPEVLPEIEGWEVAAMYRPAGMQDEVEVGGDFYDFFQTESGWIVLVGDVTGKGVQAAAVTSLVRHGGRFLAKQQRRPGAILALLDEALRERGGLWLCSALCLRLSAEGAEISSAGHPSPLIIRSDGRLREIAATGPILGAWSGSSWRDYPLAVGPEETLLIYTDGVTDARGEHERFGMRRLRRVLRAHATNSPAGLLDELGAVLDRFQDQARADDTAILALRRVRNRTSAGAAAADSETISALTGRDRLSGRRGEAGRAPDAAARGGA